MCLNKISEMIIEVSIVCVIMHLLHHSYFCVLNKTLTITATTSIKSIKSN